MAVGPQGLNLIMGMSPEKVKYSDYGANEGMARTFGNVGSKARLGLGALSGLNSLYNATSSGQPGALSALGQGAMSGYYGSQGLEQWAADKGNQFGEWRNQRNAAAEEKRNTVAGVTPSARQEAMSMMPSGPMPGNTTMPPPAGYQLPTGPTTPQDSSTGQAFAEAASDPKKVGVTTSPVDTKITDYPTKHPLVTEEEGERE